MHTTNETTKETICRHLRKVYYTAYIAIGIVFGVGYSIGIIVFAFLLYAEVTSDPTTCEMLEDIYEVMRADAVDGHAEPAIAQSASDFMDAVDDHCTD